MNTQYREKLDKLMKGFEWTDRDFELADRCTYAINELLGNEDWSDGTGTTIVSLILKAIVKAKQDE